MQTTNAKKARQNQMEPERYDDLKRMLEDRKREVLAEVQEKIRDVRSENSFGKMNEVLDSGESSEADIQEDIEFALIQMKAETLSKINEALARLEEGAYGYCFECGQEISQQRLRALPFAVRCRDCEEAREVAARRERIMAQRQQSASIFFDLYSFGASFPWAPSAGGARPDLPSQPHRPGGGVPPENREVHG
jgi:DnaK suppressor protein